MEHIDEADDLDPPAGLTFSHVIPVTSLIVDKIGNGYKILETPHSQEKHTKCFKHKRSPRIRTYFSAELTAKRLRILANSGNVEELQAFFEKYPRGKELVNNPDSKKRTALHFATSRGSDDLVHLLLQEGANPNVQDLNGNTPLHLAACTHHIRVVTLLLRYGANVQLTDFAGKTPLHLSLARLRMLSRSGEIDNNPRRRKFSSYSTEKRKIEVGEIIAMLTEYFDKSGQKEDYFKMCEMRNQLLAVETDEEIDEVNSLLTNFTQMTIDVAERAKMSEE